MTRDRLISRRSLLVSSGALFAWSHVPRMASAGTRRDPRLLIVILRGGMDGLAAVPPLGDPTYHEDRGLTAGAGTRPLDGIFALHASFSELAELYRARQAIVMHAAATPYRGHSHFDAQDVLEAGFGGLPGRSDSGWLNRALERLEPGETLPRPGGAALGSVVPLVMRGQAPVQTWQPPALPTAQAGLIGDLEMIYAETDPKLAAALRAGAATDRMMRGGTDKLARSIKRASGVPDFATQAAAAARLMARPNGPRVAAMSYYGWDTHAQQGTLEGRLAKQFVALDTAIGVLRKALDAVWSDTVVLVVTEFGRTVEINGTLGTDHGTATAAFLVGGAVNGGRVIADWPGLKADNLLEGRDLRPTLDLRSIFKGVLLEHLGVSSADLETYVFPESTQAQPYIGLCRSA